MISKILITGGAGFIGSHMAALLMEKNIHFTVIDNLKRSTLKNIKILEQHFKIKIDFNKIDILDSEHLDNFFSRNNFNTVIHFAGLKSVKESILNPELYFHNNVDGTRNIISCIKKYSIEKFIFSSSATVYGNPNYLPIDEGHEIRPLNPYAISKNEVENLLINDLNLSKNLSIKILRYFNPIGSYKGIIGENITKYSSNIMPSLINAIKNNKDFIVYGNDFETNDGTGVRDYIHVMDLIDAHFRLINDTDKNLEIFNIGTGQGTSVLELLNVFEKISNKKIKFKILDRRDGDLSASYASVDKIKKIKNWNAKFSIEDMCFDAWDFAMSNSV